MLNYVSIVICRDEIAACSEKAYAYLSITDAKRILMFSSDQELTNYVTQVHTTSNMFPFCSQILTLCNLILFRLETYFQEHIEWEIKNGSVFFQKTKESSPCKEIPSLQLINQTLSYARELERIV